MSRIIHGRAGQSKTVCGCGPGHAALYWLDLKVKSVLPSKLSRSDGAGDARPCKRCLPIARRMSRQECPPIGALFGYNGSDYRLTGYLLAREPLPEPRPEEAGFSVVTLLNSIIEQSSHQRDGKVFQDCRRKEATHVSGSGVGGCIAAIGDIAITGSVLGKDGCWTASRLEDDERRAVEAAERGAVVF